MIVIMRAILIEADRVAIKKPPSAGDCSAVESLGSITKDMEGDPPKEKS
jgi:hypothetical protein